MARLPHSLLALMLLVCCLNMGLAQESPHRQQPMRRANQGASLTHEPQPSQAPQSGNDPQRSRMPPVRLAQHTEQLSATSAGEASSSEPLSTDAPLAQPLRLARPQSATDGSGNSNSKPIDATSSMITVGTSLAVVLGLFFVLSYFFRRNLPKSVQTPPGEVLEVLGRAPLPGKQQLQVVRFGSKLVLLSVTAEGVEPVSEITSPDEVQQLTALCRRESPGSSAHAFQEILTQMGREPARGFVDQRAAKTQLSAR